MIAVHIIVVILIIAYWIGVGIGTFGWLTANENERGATLNDWLSARSNHDSALRGLNKAKISGASEQDIRRAVSKVKDCAETLESVAESYRTRREHWVIIFAWPYYVVLTEILVPRRKDKRQQESLLSKEENKRLRNTNVLLKELSKDTHITRTMSYKYEDHLMTESDNEWGS